QVASFLQGRAQTAVFRLLSAASRVKLFPGCLRKLLACLATTVHFFVEQVADASWIVTVSDCPGISARLRSSTTLPLTVADPCDADALDNVYPEGAVKSAEPSCCVAFSLTNLAVTVEPFAATPSVSTRE